jgi:hypothetical protein
MTKRVLLICSGVALAAGIGSYCGTGIGGLCAAQFMQ